jgi:WD40 repeat protein
MCDTTLAVHTTSNTIVLYNLSSEVRMNSVTDFDDATDHIVTFPGTVATFYFEVESFTDGDTYCMWQQTRHPDMEELPLSKLTCLNGQMASIYFTGCMTSIVQLQVPKSYDRVIAAMTGMNIMVWDKKGTPLALFRGHHGMIQAIACASTYPLLVSVAFDKSIRHWDLDTLKEKKHWGAQKNWWTGNKKPQTISITNDGRLVIGYDSKDLQVLYL